MQGGWVAGRGRYAHRHWVQMLLGAVLLASVGASPVWAGKPLPENIVVTVRPLAVLAAELFPEAEITGLIESGQDPHHFQLTPSQLGVIGQADLVLWQGAEVEPWLGRILARREVTSMALESDEHGSSHAEHAHGIHPWLDPEVMLDFADAVAAHYAHAPDVSARAALMRANVIAVMQRARQQNKAPVRWFVSHDALAEWAAAMQLENGFALAAMEGGNVGARRARDAIAWAAEQKPACIVIFTHEEDSLSPGLLRLHEATGLPLVTLDILAQRLPAAATLADFYQSLADDFARCRLTAVAD